MRYRGISFPRSLKVQIRHQEPATWNQRLKIVCAEIIPAHSALADAVPKSMKNLVASSFESEWQLPIAFA
jgi:hypothetical protein